MPGSGPGVDISMGSAVVQPPTSVSAPASPDGSITTLGLSSSSTPTPSSVDAAQTPNELTTAQPPQTIQSRTPSASLVDSSFSSSSMTDPTNTFFAAQQNPDVPPPGDTPPAVHTKAPAPTLVDTFSSTTPSRSTIPSRPHPLEPPRPTTESNLAASAAPPSRSPTRPSPPTGAPNAGNAVSFEDRDKGRHLHDDDKGKSTPTISHIFSGETFYTKSGHSQPFTKWWTELPQHAHDHDVVSKSHDAEWITIVSTTTDSGTVFQTTLTLESIGPGSPVSTPTKTSNVSPDSASSSNNLLPLILGVVLGMVALVALAAVFFRLRGRRRRSKFMPKVLSSDSDTSREREDGIMTETTPRLKTVTRITPYRPPSTYATEHVTPSVSFAGESFQSSDGPLSDPFADSSTTFSSRADTRPASLCSVDGVSTVLEFAMSVDTDIREGGESVRLIDESTSSLELHFVPPPVVARRDSLVRSSYWSPTWHYDSQSPLSSSSRRVESQNEEGRGGPSNVTMPTSSQPFLLGAESARLRLHALLKEARRV